MINFLARELLYAPSPRKQGKPMGRCLACSRLVQVHGLATPFRVLGLLGDRR
jgi:hypothetical protein